jgi:uncharacterized protein with von Willebrand factor type A (vWA) domain
MDKFARAETEFKLENTNVDKLVKEIHTLANQILNELTIRFTVQIQREYYDHMDRVFSKTKDLEAKMSEMAYNEEQAKVNASRTSQRIHQDYATQQYQKQGYQFQGQGQSQHYGTGYNNQYY